MLKLSRYRAVTPPFVDEVTGAVHRLVFATRTAVVRLIDEPTWQRLEGGDWAGLPPAALADMTGSELLVPADEDELRTVLSRNRAAAAGSTSAYLVIQPTAACQFGCGYCGQSHQGKTLCADHQEALVARARGLLAGGKYESLDVGWFGGEATLALDEIRGLTGRFQAVAAEMGCTYNAKLVSNGYRLSAELAAELVNELSVSAIEVTLDGTREHHDRSRPTKGGGPTFERIFQNLLAIGRRGDLQFRLSIRCNVSRDNRDGVLDLLELLAGEGLQDRLGVYAAMVRDWGNDARRDFGSPTEEFAAWEIEFLIRAHQLGFRPDLIPARKSITCMAVRPDAEMIDAYGNRFNCTEVSYVSAYEGPADTPPGRLALPLVEARSRTNRYAIGHLDLAEEIPERRAIFGGFYGRIERGEYPCHTCPMLPVCGGSCPKSWHEGAAACPPAKFNIAQRLLVYYALERESFQDVSAVPT